MDFTPSLYETFVYTECCIPINAFLDEEYAEPAPLAFGRWTWRTAVVIVGIGISIATFVCAVLELTSSITMLTLATTAILCFALYYVSRFEEQRRMSVLLDDLEDEVEVLKDANATYAAQNERLEKTGEQLSTEVTTLKETNGELTTNLETTATSLSEAQALNENLSSTVTSTKELQEATQAEFDKYKAANEHLADEIQKRITLMDERDKACREKQAELDRLTEKFRTDTAALAKISGEVEQLERTRAELNQSVAEFKETLSQLQTGIQTGASQQQALQKVVDKLQELTSPATTPTKFDPKSDGVKA